MSTERQRVYFTQTEAEAKIGQRIQTARAFSAVPKASTGLVVSADLAQKVSVGADGYDVAVQWDLPRPRPFADVVIPRAGEPYIHIQTGNPLVDWFTKDEYARFLTELETSSDAAV